MGQGPAQFENHHVADEIGPDVGEGMVDRVAHARLSGEMHHVVNVRVCSQRLVHGLSLGDVELEKGEGRVALKPGKPRFLERDFVVIIQVVETDHRLASGDQGFAQVIADEPGSAGDENGHVGPDEAD